MMSYRILLYVLNAALLLIVIILFYLIFAKISDNQTESSKTKIEQVRSHIAPSIVPEKKSGADLSYIMIRADSGSTLKLLDKNDYELGQSFTEEPLYDIVTGEASGSPLQALDYAKPKSGHYKLIIGGKNSNTIDIYLYDRGAGVKMINLTDVNVGEDILIDFDKENVNNSTIK